MFGANAIAVVTDGLRRSTGSFEERLMSHGLVGDIQPTVTTIRRILWGKWFKSIRSTP